MMADKNLVPHQIEKLPERKWWKDDCNLWAPANETNFF